MTVVEVRMLVVPTARNRIHPSHENILCTVYGTTKQIVAIPKPKRTTFLKYKKIGKPQYLRNSVRRIGVAIAQNITLIPNAVSGGYPYRKSK